MLSAGITGYFAAASPLETISREKKKKNTERRALVTCHQLCRAGSVSGVGEKLRGGDTDLSSWEGSGSCQWLNGDFFKVS